MNPLTHWQAEPTRFSPRDLTRTFARRGFAMPMSGAWPAGAIEAPSCPPTVVDRGATTVVLGGAGMLGARLVEKLLQPRDRGLVVVISRNPATLRQRLQQVYGAERGHEIYSDSRLQLMSGDIGAPDFAAHFDVPDVGVIYNLAAQVDAFASLDQLMRINCNGTKAACTIARISGARLVHASTLSVFASADGGDETVEDWLPDDPNITIRGGYAQSKAIAETHVAQHQARHGSAAAVRLGLLVPDALEPIEGASFLTTFVHALSRIGLIPAGAEEALVDMTPIDQAAGAMLAIGDGGGSGVFHYACPKSLSLTQAVQQINRVTPLALTSAEVWHDALTAQPSLTQAILHSAFFKQGFLKTRCETRPLLNADLFQSTSRQWGCARALALGAPHPRAAAETFAALADRALAVAVASS